MRTNSYQIGNCVVHGLTLWAFIWWNLYFTLIYRSTERIMKNCKTRRPFKDLFLDLERVEKFILSNRLNDIIPIRTQMVIFWVHRIQMIRYLEGVTAPCTILIETPGWPSWLGKWSEHSSNGFDSLEIQPARVLPLFPVLLWQVAQWLWGNNMKKISKMKILIQSYFYYEDSVP